jgi:hypothetical protein
MKAKKKQITPDGPFLKGFEKIYASPVVKRILDVPVGDEDLYPTSPIDLDEALDEAESHGVDMSDDLGSLNDFGDNE